MRVGTNLCSDVCDGGHRKLYENRPCKFAKVCACTYSTSCTRSRQQSSLMTAKRRNVQGSSCFGGDVRHRLLQIVGLR